MNEQLSNWFKVIMILLVTIILLSVIVEALFLVSSFVMADSIDCNWLWCTFTTIRAEGLINQTITSYIGTNQVISRTCFENGQKVNCSKIDKVINLSTG